MAKKIKVIDSPGETRRFQNGQADLLNLGDFSIMRLTFQPGWRWSNSVKPIVKTESCQSHHIGYAISGMLKVVSEDGEEKEITPGSAYEIMPGHDAWVIGDEAFTALELSQDTVVRYARPPQKI
jgi:quercetin dioxygenase-like cupin family protein